MWCINELGIISVQLYDSSWDQFPRVAITNYHKLGGLKQHVCIVSQLCRPGVQNQSGLVPSWRLRTICSMPLPVAILGIPWLWQCTNLCVAVSKLSFFCKECWSLDKGLCQYSVIHLNFLSVKTVSKEGHIHGQQGTGLKDIFGGQGTQFNPQQLSR